MVVVVVVCMGHGKGKMGQTEQGRGKEKTLNGGREGDTVTTPEEEEE